MWFLVMSIGALASVAVGQQGCVQTGTPCRQNNGRIGVWQCGRDAVVFAQRAGNNIAASAPACPPCRCVNDPRPQPPTQPPPTPPPTPPPQPQCPLTGTPCRNAARQIGTLQCGPDVIVVASALRFGDSTQPTCPPCRCVVIFQQPTSPPAPVCPRTNDPCGFQNRGILQCGTDPITIRARGLVAPSPSAPCRPCRCVFVVRRPTPPPITLPRFFPQPPVAPPGFRFGPILAFDETDQSDLTISCGATFCHNRCQRCFVGDDAKVAPVCLLTHNNGCADFKPSSLSLDNDSAPTTATTTTTTSSVDTATPQPTVA